MQLDHVAIAVRSVDAAADRLCRLLGYARKTAKVTNSRQQVTVLFLGKAGSLDLKLIEPSSAESPLWNSLKKGEGLHHLCFRVDDVTRVTEALHANGGRVLAAPAPGEAFGGAAISFCYLGFGMNVEFIDTDIRAALIERL